MATIDFSQNKSEYQFISFNGGIIYIIGLLYLGFIIVNLIIAVVGDTYEKIMSVKKQTELKLLAEMLHDQYLFEKLFFPQNEELGYLIRMKYVENTESSDDWEGRVNYIVKNIRTSIESVERGQDKINERLDSQNAAIKQGLDSQNAAIKQGMEA